MNTTLISFLGRTPKGENGYRTTRYRFADGVETDPVAFFGWALRERIAPQRMAILGTAGSMWDHLFEGDIDLGADEVAARIDLISAVEQKKVTQAMLDALTPALARALQCELSLVIIPYASNHAEQIEIVGTIARQVGEQDCVHLDVTHGFRHLPMLALLAALYVRSVRNAEIAGIWYGSYDPETGQAPVYELSGLLALADGIQALASFDKDGDYRVFVPLLKKAGLAEQTCALLESASYYENILNLGAATGELRKVKDQLKDDGLTQDAKLLLPHIKKRIEWLDEDRQYQKQIHLARLALNRGDYLRATLYAYEAVITRLCQASRIDINNYEGRKGARDDYENKVKAKGGEERADYRLLKNLRHQVAHGTRGSIGEVQQILLSEAKMREELDRIIRHIENGSLPKIE